MPIFGPPNIEKLTAKRDIDGLIKALGYEKDAGIRQAAAKALISFGALAFNELAAALQDKNLNIRHGAAWVLGRAGDKRAVPFLLPMLKDPHPFIRQAAADSLGELGDGMAVGPLIHLSQDENNGVRKAVARALGELHDPKAVDTLISMLGISEVQDPLIKLLRISTPDAEIRAIAAWALGEIKDSRSVEALILAVQKDASEQVRKSAAWALGQLGDPRAIAPLTTLFMDTYEDVRAMAAQSLEQLGWIPEENAMGAQYWILQGQWESCIKIGAPAVEPLIETVQSNQNRDVRRAAALSLGRIRDPRAVEPLIKVIDVKDYTDHPISIAAATALGMLGDERAVQPLISILHASWGIGEAAARSLVQIGAPAVQPLQAQLQSTRDPEIKLLIRLILAQIGDPRALEAVLPLLEEHNTEIVDIANAGLIRMGTAAVASLLLAIRPYNSTFQSTPAREAAKQVLLKIGADSKQGFVDALHHGNYYVRLGAADMLDKLGWNPDDGEAGAWYWSVKHEWDKCLALEAHAAAPLLAVLKNDDSKSRQDALIALRQLKHPNAIGMLVSALVDKPIREPVEDALRTTGAKAVPQLIAALNDENEELRAAAALILGQIHDEQALQPLIHLLQTGRESASRIAAAKALGMLGNQKALEPLHQATKDEQGEARIEIAIILGRMGDRRALEPLCDALKDERETVRSTAVDVLESLGDARAVEPLLSILANRKWWDAIHTRIIKALGSIGDARAIEPLISILNDPVWSVRHTAANSLVRIYASGKANEAATKQILAYRDSILQPHSDYHSDSTESCGFVHHDNQHDSGGIGVDFPL
ncbi:MAG: HEAT repeat domain-containing protein [Chloroflexi bacterium]|nr:HEAT repeat domain-containing protein [Chloroflexota bacterium]